MGGCQDYGHSLGPLNIVGAVLDTKDPKRDQNFDNRQYTLSPKVGIIYMLRALRMAVLYLGPPGLVEFTLRASQSSLLQVAVSITWGVHVLAVLITLGLQVFKSYVLWGQK